MQTFALIRLLALSHAKKWFPNMGRLAAKVKQRVVVVKPGLASPFVCGICV